MKDLRDMVTVRFCTREKFFRVRIQLTEDLRNLWEWMEWEGYVAKDESITEVDGCVSRVLAQAFLMELPTVPQYDSGGGCELERPDLEFRSAEKWIRGCKQVEACRGLIEERFGTREWFRGMFEVKKGIREFREDMRKLKMEYDEILDGEDPGMAKVRKTLAVCDLNIRVLEDMEGLPDENGVDRRVEIMDEIGVLRQVCEEYITQGEYVEKIEVNARRVRGELEEARKEAGEYVGKLVKEDDRNVMMIPMLMGRFYRERFAGMEYEELLEMFECLECDDVIKGNIALLMVKKITPE